VAPACRGAAVTTAVFFKLLSIIAMVSLGWLAARMRWIGGTDRAGSAEAARVLGGVAFMIFVPALLFRTTARLDLAALPWRTLAAFFVPVLMVVLAVLLQQRRHGAGRRHGAAAPAVRAITVGFGNSVQVGIPMAAALFGEAGLGIHIALVSLHALVLLTVLTAAAELDVAHAGGAGGIGGTHVRVPLSRTLGATLRNTVVHPVVLPVLAGLAWNLGGWGLHPAVDETLALLSAAVVQVCLVLIGLNLAAHGLRGHLAGALRLSALKLLLLPAVVLVAAHWGFGLQGLPLAVVVMLAALPVGSNALLFAQRYGVLEAEVTAAIVSSTLAFGLTAALWLAVLAAMGG